MWWEWIPVDPLPLDGRWAACLLACLDHLIPGRTLLIPLPLLSCSGLQNRRPAGCSPRVFPVLLPPSPLRTEASSQQEGGNHRNHKSKSSPSVLEPLSLPHTRPRREGTTWMRARRSGQPSIHGTWSFLRQVVNGMTPRSRRIYIFMGLVIVSMLMLQLVNSSLNLVFQVNINREPKSVYGSTYTIRVNTFRRNDLLKAFVEHFTTCPNVHAIQVVWSDQDAAPPPMSFFKLGANQRVPVVFERQPTNSLNNRFKAMLPVETPAVFSVDDDLIISCKDLDFAHQVWQSSPQSLVGFTPRLATWDKEQQGYHYQSSWKIVWWHGVYNIILTKCCFLHRDYLGTYFTSLSKEMLAYVDQHRNCEDIAMQFVVSNATGGAPPVWVHARFQDRGQHSGISQGKDHERERSHCVTRLVKEFGGHMPLTVTSHKAIDARKAWWY